MAVHHNHRRQYHHDCDQCVYLGEHSVEMFYDLYVCSTATATTVIARYGDDGPEYISGLGFVEHDEALAEAYRRAVENDYLQSGKVVK